MAAVLAAGLRAGGVEVAHDAFFDTVTARVPGRAEAVVAAAHAAGVNLRRGRRRPVGHRLRRDDDPGAPRGGLGGVRGGGRRRRLDAATPSTRCPSALRRTTDYLTHPVFHEHRSETAMLRYLRRLADIDYALDRGMIPLGSCTMKLNATAEMEPITWPEFANLHPFAPAGQTAGYPELIADLERWLAELTGYDAVSVQPNAGSQGELAGLLAIRAYHRAAARAPRRVPDPVQRARHQRGSAP